MDFHDEDDYYMDWMEDELLDAINDEQFGVDENGWPRVTNFSLIEIKYFEESVRRYNVGVGEEVLRVLPYGIMTGTHRPGKVWHVEGQGCLVKKPGYSEPNDMGLTQFWALFNRIRDK